MSLTSRILIAGTPHHVIRKTADHTEIFKDKLDYRYCIHHIRDLRDEYNIAIHAWCLLPDRIHLLMTPKDNVSAISDFMKSLSCRAAMRYKRRHHADSTPWEYRYRSSPVQPGQWLLACMSYIEHLPAVAGLVKSAFHYPHSSYRMRLGKEHFYWLDDHEDYLQLGQSIASRADSYRDYFNAGLCPWEMQNIEAAIMNGELTGCEQFRRKVMGARPQ